MSRPTKYRVYITPRTSEDTYGDEVEVSDRIQIKGMQAIRRNIDSSDYDFGAFTYSDVSLTCHNSDGYFNDFQDSRSMFPHKRDLAKVRIVYGQELDIETVTYRGIINDEATSVNMKTDEITFRVLSRDSVIRKVKIPAGTVSDDVDISEALHVILNRDEITLVLNIDIDNINPGSDLTVDDGSSFDDQEARSAINDLLVASNSVMLIDEDDNVIVRSRAHNEDKEPLRLYGKGDLRGRENIIDMSGYNIGLQRVFNSITVNDRNVADTDSILAYGARTKDVTFDWLTDNDSIDAIAAVMLSEFSYPKIELEVSVDTFLAKDYDLLDTVTVDYPLCVFPPPGKKLPFANVARTDDEDTPTPFVVGAIEISPMYGFKIIEKREDTRKFLTVLKLRQIGTTLEDGFI